MKTDQPDLPALRRHLREIEAERCGPAGSPSGQARRFERFAARGDVRLRSDLPEASIPPHFGLLRDLSRGGAGVLVSHPIELGAAFHMELRTGDTVAGVMPGFCRHCRCVGPDAYLVGMAFSAEAALLLAFGISEQAIRVGDRCETPLIEGDFLAADDAAA